MEFNSKWRKCELIIIFISIKIDYYESIRRTKKAEDSVKSKT